MTEPRQKPMVYTFKVKMLLDKKKMKQADLCEITGLSKSHVSNIINNNSDPSTSNLLKIASALQVPLSEILHDPFYGVTSAIPIPDNPMFKQALIILDGMSPNQIQKAAHILHGFIVAELGDDVHTNMEDYEAKSQPEAED